MVPSWVITTLVIFVAGIFACIVGSVIPDDPHLGIYILALSAVCTIAAVINKFPALLAFGLWTPFPLPVPGLKSLPTIALIYGWIVLILLFRLCLTGSLRYIKSYNLFLLLAICWVPIRFFIHPINKVGAGVMGGGGVSGAFPYFGYFFVFWILLLTGSVLNTRESIMSYMRWSFGMVLVIGLLLFYCAFHMWTKPYLVAMGSFSAGNMGDGIQRLVQMPAYGIFLMEAACCPNLFRLGPKTAVSLFFLGFAMVIVGGDRLATGAMVCAVPTILILRRKTHALALAVALSVAGIVAVHFAVVNMDSHHIPRLLRFMGVFDAKIDEASGGKATTEWRHEVWQDSIKVVMENPLLGKGYGNLPKRLDPAAIIDGHSGGTSFEVLLAGGEIHNGFISSAYAFGIPFTLVLTAFVFIRFWSHVKSALSTDRNDPELRDLHALLAGIFATVPAVTYGALELSQPSIWTFASIGYILAQLKARSALDRPQPSAQPAGTGDYQGYRYLPQYSKR